MLFVALLAWVVGYSMMYAALHGNWQFWKYLIPATAAPPATPSASAQPATPAA